MSAPAEGIAWRAWPLRKSPARGVFAAVVIAAACYGVWSWTRDPWLLALAVVVLSSAVGKFFVPTRYRLSAAGVEIAGPWRRRHRRWADFRGVRSDERLLLLTPSRRPTWLDAFRGETLLLEGNGGEIRSYVEAMVGRAAGAAEE
jgi:hypothetical protein